MKEWIRKLRQGGPVRVLWFWINKPLLPHPDMDRRLKSITMWKNWPLFDWERERATFRAGGRTRVVRCTWGEWDIGW